MNKSVKGYSPLGLYVFITNMAIRLNNDMIVFLEFYSGWHPF
jgi:hypothetical protein